MNAAIVDVHAHMVPPGLIDAVRAGEFPEISLTETGDGPALTAGTDRLGPLDTAMTIPETRLQWMAERSIDEQWVSPWLDLVTWHRFENAQGRRWAAAINRSLATMTDMSGGKLRPVPIADLTAGAAVAADDIAELAERLRPPAVMVSTNAPAGIRSLGDRSVEPLWSRLSELGTAMLLHPPVDGPSRTFTAPVLQNVSGRLTDTSTAVLDLMTAGVFERFPGLHVIVVHGGGFLPYQAFRLDGLVRAGLIGRTEMTAAPSVILRRLLFDTVALDALSIELLVRRVGANQVLLGSDAPFPIGDPDPVGTVLAASLTEEAKQAVCGGNARGLTSCTAGPDSARR